MKIDFGKIFEVVIITFYMNFMLLHYSTYYTCCIEATVSSKRYFNGRKAFSAGYLVTDTTVNIATLCYIFANHYTLYSTSSLFTIHTLFCSIYMKAHALP